MSESEKDEALAEQLFAIHEEALGFDRKHNLNWDTLHPNWREAWIQVAQFIQQLIAIVPDHK